VLCGSLAQITSLNVELRGLKAENLALQAKNLALRAVIEKVIALMGAESDEESDGCNEAQDSARVHVRVRNTH
jgi:hypothetical protein